MGIFNFNHKEDKNITTNNNELKVLISNDNQDPFWTDVIFNYFNDNFISEEEALDCYKKISSQKDVLNEFSRCVLQNDYDKCDELIVDGFTPKMVYELNPTFKIHEVFLYMVSMKENPEKTKELIDKQNLIKDNVE